MICAAFFELAMFQISSLLVRSGCAVLGHATPLGEEPVPGHAIPARKPRPGRESEECGRDKAQKKKRERARARYGGKPIF